MPTVNSSWSSYVSHPTYEKRKYIEEEKHKLYLESIPTIKYNQKVFMNFDVENMVLDMFNKIVS